MAKFKTHTKIFYSELYIHNPIKMNLNHIMIKSSSKKGSFASGRLEIFLITMITWMPEIVVANSFSYKQLCQTSKRNEIIIKSTIHMSTSKEVSLRFSKCTCMYVPSMKCLVQM